MSEQKDNLTDLVEVLSDIETQGDGGVPDKQDVVTEGGEVVTLDQEEGESK